MEVNKTEIEEIIHTKGNNVLPRPISERNCECGCGHLFYPRRRDNIYLNKQHADFAYNHGKRKAKNQNRIRIDKILLKNNNVLDKHYKTVRNTKHAEIYFDILNADGFNFGYNTGSSVHDEIEYFYSYNYYYCILVVEKIKIIKILKR